MPYGAPDAGPYGQPMAPGREPWRLDRRTPETGPQRVPSAEGPFREEGTVIHVLESVLYAGCEIDEFSKEAKLILPKPSTTLWNNLSKSLKNAVSM